MIRMTDHAILRLLERRAGFDIEALRGAVEARVARAHAAAAELGVAVYAIRLDDAVYVVRRGMITTVLNGDLPPAGVWRALSTRDVRP